MPLTSLYSVARMFVQVTQCKHGKSTYFTYLVRESFRTPKGPRSRTVCNITALPEPTRDLIAHGIPIFGICLGHQILGQAFGGKTFKLKFGHRGANQPVKDLESGKVDITAQNHGFAVDPASLPSDVVVDRINLNDQTIEGFRHKTKPVFCVQYHPEASPGPHDSTPLFAQFRALAARS